MLYNIYVVNFSMVLSLDVARVFMICTVLEVEEASVELDTYSSD